MRSGQKEVKNMKSAAEAQSGGENTTGTVGRRTETFRLSLSVWKFHRGKLQR